MAELLARISSRELSEWMAYFELEPWGEERADLRSAIVAANVAELGRDRKRRPRPYQVRDFMPQFGRRDIEGEAEASEERWRRMLSTVEALNAAMGGRDLRSTDARRD